MSTALATARFTLARLYGLALRAWASLRTRGWRATWSRIRVHARPPAAHERPTLFAPPVEPFAPFAVPSDTTPVVSIVIPVYNQAPHTLACLRALAAYPPSVACEILVIDDGSSDDTVHWLPRIDGLRYERRAANGGFIEACNDGVSRSRGQFVVLLNNDTVPQPGWLDALLETFTQVPDAGLVGSQLLYPDGRLQESGAVLLSDGSGWSYGRFESADDPRFTYRRDTHYCSGAAVMVRRAVWDSLGGLDVRYRPAYYEDADLAMRVRARGLRVLVQPASRVVHDEGTSHGTDIRTGLKAHQVRNRAVFAERWADTLTHHPGTGSVPSPAVLHAHQPQVLVIDETLPHPDRDSASLRQVRLLQLLQDEGAHVVFAATRHADGDAGSEALCRSGVETWPASQLGGLARWLAAHGRRFDSIVLVRHHLARACLPLVRRFAPQARIVFDTVDLHYLRETRGAELANDAALLTQARKTRQRELSVMKAAHLTVLVSAAEQEQLRQDAPDVPTVLISNLHRVREDCPGFAQRSGIVFVGGFGHPPNVDAMHWFLDTVWPRVQAALPEISFHCIGQNPPASLRELAASRDGVHIHGHVPDITPWMLGARLAVAPLRFGAGVKGKVNLSMAHGQPVVATTCAAEGMHLQHGQDVMIADAADAFAEAVIAAYTDQTLWERLAAGGQSNIQQHFSLDVARDAVRKALLPTP